MKRLRICSQVVVLLALAVIVGAVGYASIEPSSRSSFEMTAAGQIANYGVMVLIATCAVCIAKPRAAN